MVTDNNVTIEEITDPEVRSAFNYLCEQVNLINNEDLRGKLFKIMDEWLQRWETPAAVKFHGAFSGGNLVHTRDVLRIALATAQTVRKSIEDTFDPDFGIDADFHARNRTEEDRLVAMQQVNDDSIRIVCILHDMNKLMDPAGRPLYVKNILTDGTQSEKKPWVTNQEYSFLGGVTAGLDDNFTNNLMLKLIAGLDDNIRTPSGMSSLIAAERMAPGILDLLSPDEKQAIMFHDGMYGNGPHSGLEGKETPLVITVHHADMIASRCLN